MCGGYKSATTSPYHPTNSQLLPLWTVTTRHLSTPVLPWPSPCIPHTMSPQPQRHAHAHTYAVTHVRPPLGPLFGRVDPMGEVSMMDVWLVALPWGLPLRHLSALWIKRPFVSSESSAVESACNFTALSEREGDHYRGGCQGSHQSPDTPEGLSFPSIFSIPVSCSAPKPPLSYSSQPTTNVQI